MPAWLKILTTLSVGFLTGALTSQQAGGKRKDILVSGTASAALALGSLITTSPLNVKPADKELEKD